MKSVAVVGLLLMVGLSSAHADADPVSDFRVEAPKGREDTVRKALSISSSNAGS